MRFMDWIIDLLYDTCLFFYDARQEVEDWVWPFYLLALPFDGLYDAFYYLAKAFEDFDEWVDDIADRIRDLLDFGDIWSYFRDWFTWAEDAWNWVRNAWDRVTNIVDDWWLVTSSTVGGWIAAATEGFDDLVEAWDTFWHITWPELLGNVHTLSETWDNFWTVIFPDLVSFTWLGIWWDARLLDMQSLIESWAVTLSPFWEGWQDVRDNVLEFFNDPLEWLWVRFTDWFLGPEG